jgi:hypothetical protein
MIRIRRESTDDLLETRRTCSGSWKLTVEGLAPVEVPHDVRFDFPGLYQDGDGPGDNSGPTSSDLRRVAVE